MQTINIESLHEELKLGHGQVVDVRTPMEFESVHMDSSVNIPLDEITGDVLTCREISMSDPVYILCQSGTRAKTACKKLDDVENLIVIDGGIQAWVEKGYPVIRGREVISLERQVRIAAGSIVFVATMLGYFISPFFLLVSGFVGAGLVFAGVTDTCGMGILLSKCPWNKSNSTTCAMGAKS